MPRIPAVEMEKREEALQSVMESNPDGLTVAEMLAGLKQKGITLPKNEYQAIYVVLKRAEKAKIVENSNGKWRLLEEEEGSKA